MINNVKKCALKRTAKKAGVWALGIGLGVTALLAVATVFGFILDAFPIIHTIFIFALSVMMVMIFLGMPIIAACDEYKRNVRDCEDEESM